MPYGQSMAPGRPRAGCGLASPAWIEAQNEDLMNKIKLSSVCEKCWAQTNTVNKFQKP